MSHALLQPLRSFGSLACACALLALVGGCARTTTQVQVRDAADHAPLVGQSVGALGPLNGYKWAITDTDGVARVRTRPDWSELPIVVAGPGHRIAARGTLLPGTDAWVPLTPEPGSQRRVEARVAAGEGAPVLSTPNPDHND